MHAIAHGLAAAGHEVHLVDGGRPVPRPAAAGAVAPVLLAPLVRADGRVVAPGSHAPANAVLAERARALAGAVERLRPDVFLVDHYPFSKWELEPEILAAAAAARRCNPGVRVLCSLRDVVPRTRHEAAAGDGYEARVLERLHAQFDGVLVHADPSFTRLEEHFGRAAELRVPIAYTGFVTVAPPSGPAPSEPTAVVSAGGGTRALPFLMAAIEACGRLPPAMRVAVFAGLAQDGAELRTLGAAARDGRFELHPFSADFAGGLAASHLSVSRAGYNTTVELLQARVRAVVVPDPRMSDQGPRARRLAARGLATVVDGDPPSVDALGAAIERALAGPAPRHDLDLAGVAATVRLLEGLGTGSEAGWDSTPTSTLRSTPA